MKEVAGKGAYNQGCMEMADGAMGLFQLGWKGEGKIGKGGQNQEGKKKKKL